MKKEIVMEFVIYVVFPSAVKKYVTGMYTRPDNRLMPTDYSTNIDAAKTYGSESAVQVAIGRINNIHDRVFEYESINTELTSSKKARILGDNINSVI